MKNSVKICLLLCTLMSLLVFSGCGKNNAPKSEPTNAPSATVSTAAETRKTEAETTVTEAGTAAADVTTAAEAETTTAIEQETETENTAAVSATETEAAANTAAETTEVSETAVSVEREGSYTTPEDVAEYIHTFGTLPQNFITKNEAKALGWDSGKGNLWDVADGKSIGGDRFGNYEKQLPTAKGRKYTECDVNYEGGYRGSERIIFSNDGLIFYTDDHYKTFTQLY